MYIFDKLKDKMENIIEIQSEDQMKEILSSVDENQSVIIDFYASWCGPCKALLPIAEKVANENDDIILMKINVDQNASIARKPEFMVRSIPTLFFYRDGEIKSSLLGIQSEDTLIKQARG